MGLSYPWVDKRPMGGSEDLRMHTKDVYRGVGMNMVYL